MVEKSRLQTAFSIFNYVFITLIAALCFFPILNVFAISLSDRVATSAGMVSLYPVNFTTASYEYVLRDAGFIRSTGISVIRLVLGGTSNMLLTILCAYPLSKSNLQFKSRRVYVWFFLFASLFNGGLIPTFMVVRYTGLINSIWALVLPCAVPIFHVIIMINFFRGIPKEMEEAALIDGAGHLKTLFQIFVPLSKASIATLTLFSLVFHWNSWFDGMIYMTDTAKQPLATFLHNQVIRSGLELMRHTRDLETIRKLFSISNQTVKSAQIFLGMIPILCIYPFLQKYFAKGITIGSVKG